eukprot:COSAG02_NODE_3768_length_6264_cov_5.702676_5_plen_852_part_00
MLVALALMGAAAVCSGEGRRPWLGTAARRLSVDERVELLVAEMTQPEKVAQLLSAHVDEDTSDILASYSHLGFGVACLPARNSPNNATHQLKWRNELQQSIMGSSRLGIPVSFRGELLHSGAVAGATVFPTPSLLGAAWNRSLVRAVASASAAEATAGGIDYGFGPVLQVATDARWGRISEAFGEDPMLVTELGLAATEGFQGTMTGGTGDYINDATKLPMQAKHFAFYGRISHDTLPVDTSLTTLHDVYLRPFRAFVKRGGGRAVMASHPPVRYVPAVANRWLLTTVLRVEWGPEGTNVSTASDCGDVGALCEHDGGDPAMPGSRDAPGANWGVATNKQKAAELALTAGLDQELDIGMESFKFPLLSNTSTPKVVRSIDRAVRNVLRLKFASGLMDRPAVAAQMPFDRERHQELARDAARQGAVLLINRGDTLPFKHLSRAKVAVVGPLGDGLDAQSAMLGGYSSTPTGTVTTLFSAVRTATAAQGSVRFAAGANPCNATVNADEIQSAVALARSSELTLVVVGDSGGTECVTCGEGRDRTDLDLPGSQLALLRGVLDGVDSSRTKVVVVLIHGRPVTFGKDERCGRLQSCHNQLLDHPSLSAMIAAWHPGQFGAGALVDLLSGRFPFVGKLAQAWPRSVGHIAEGSGVAPWFGLPLRQGTNLERDAYASGLKTPLFPFAWGIQPGAAFSFSNLELSAREVSATDRVTVSVFVRNTGSVRSAATVQLYYSPPIAPGGVMRMARRLITFKRVWVAAEATEHLQLAFDVSESLSRYDEFCQVWNGDACAPGFVVDPGVYGLHIGDCCVSGVVNSTGTCRGQLSTILQCISYLCHNCGVLAYCLLLVFTLPYD